MAELEKSKNDEPENFSGNYFDFFRCIHRPALIVKPFADHDFLIIDFNDRFEKIDPRINRQLIGKSLFENLFIIQKNTFCEALNKVRSTGIPEFKTLLFNESRLGIWKENYIFPIHDGCIAIVFESFAQNQISFGDLLESKKHLELFFYYSNDGFFFGMLDKPIDWNDQSDKESQLQYVINNLHITKVNFALTKIYQTTEDALLGITPQLMMRRNIKYNTQLWRELLDEGRVKFEAGEILENGLEKWIETDLICFYDERGRITGNFGIQKDITERIRFEEKLQLEKEKAERADKLKSAFLANLSHEIRSPMNAIVGFTDLLSKNQIPENEKKEVYEIINLKSFQLLELVDNIIDMAKVQVGQITLRKSIVYLHDFLLNLQDYFITEITRLNKKNIEFFLDDQIQKGTEVLIDPYRLRQILVNLIDNAIKFTDSGQISLGVKFIDPQLFFYVRDTGIGISDQRIPQIFDRFNKLEEGKSRIYSGTGLGLALSKGLVDLMNGSIWVESMENHGSLFQFYIPVELKECELLKKEKVAEPLNLILDWSKKVIMVAEDEDVNFFLIKQALKETKVKLLRAHNGAEAVEIAKTETVDVILMDIKMPVMDGCEATSLIKSSSNIPILAITAYAMAEEQENCFRAGCDEYIMKPVTSRKLFDVINRYIKS